MIVNWNASLITQKYTM